MRAFLSMLLLFTGLYLTSCKHAASPDYSTWATYAGTKDGNRYSSNDQINVDNVSHLQVAWTYHTGDKDTANRSEIQCNPIVVDGMLYGTSPRLKLFALNAATGDQQWVFDPAAEDTSGEIGFGINRGLVYWQDEEGAHQRILYGAGSRLYAVNALDGTLITDFGEHGSIDLRENLDRENIENGSLFGKTPGVIYKDLLIMGMSVSEGAEALPGHVRAFDVRSGKRRWIFHTIPHPGDYGYDTWEDQDAWKKIGGANSWAGMSLDQERGIVYVPTGSASPDFYGGTRKGSNLFANSIIALDAATGEYIWHYQIVHHDLWDRDLPANPNLVTITHEGKQVDAIAQITKLGYVFLLDRTNGKPVFPIEEKPVPQNALPGEEPWPTQPVPTLPEPFSRQKFGPEDVSDLTPETHRALMERYLQIKHRVHFTPPSKEGGWMFPDFGGGGEWGGAAFDLESQVLYVNSNEVPSSLVMIDAPKNKGEDHSIQARGRTVYDKYCIACHGADLQGSGADYPSLLHVNKKYNTQQLRQIIDNGRNMMPSFQQIPAREKEVLLAFLLKTTEIKPTAQEVHQEQEAAEAENIPSGKDIRDDDPRDTDPRDEIPYSMTGYNRFVDQAGYPGNTPPWGTLNAVDLSSGKLLWKVPLGEYPELTKKGIPVTGTRNYGGPVVTKGGLVFIAATLDEKIRAFDKHTGKVLWEAKLPAAGFATPATYMVDGKQYVVIACGGGKLGSKSGDSYVAFALPDTSLLSYRDKGGLKKPVTTLAEWEKKRGQILDSMQQAMGKLPDRSALPALDIYISDSLREKNYTRLTLSFTVAEAAPRPADCRPTGSRPEVRHPKERVPAYLYVPLQKGPQKKLPAMLALHETDPLGKGSVDGQGEKANLAYAKELAQRGYVVIAPDYPGFGSLKAYDFQGDRYQSGTMKGIFDHMRCVDLLQAREDVDPERIGVIGHSLGGHNAMFVGAFDTRLKVIVSSCGWTLMDYYDIGEEAAKKYGGRLGPWAQERYMPLLRDQYKLDAEKIPFDFDEVIAALAPRAFFSNAALNDSNFDVRGVRKGIAAVSEVYRFLGAEENLQVRYPEAGHDFPPEIRLQAYRFIDKILKHTPSHSEIKQYSKQ